MPTLTWIGKDAVVNHHQEVPYHLLRDVPELGCGPADSGTCVLFLASNGHRPFLSRFRVQTY